MAALSATKVQSSSGMPRKLKDGPADVRLPMVVSKAFAQELDEWRRDQDDFPNRSEAMRRMAEMAFAERRERKAKKRGGDGA